MPKEFEMTGENWTLNNFFPEHAKTVNEAIKAGKKVVRVESSFRDVDEYVDFKVDGQVIVHITGY